MRTIDYDTTGQNNLNVRGGKLLPILALVFPLLVLCSCKKNQDAPSLEDEKSTVVYDLAGDTGASMGDGADGKEKRPFYIFLYRFSDQKQIWIKNAADSAQWLKTKDWDIAFTGPYNSEVYVNNGSYAFNPGFGGTAAGAAVMIDRPYSAVTEAPDEQAFNNTELNKIGWAASSNIGGWFFYSLDTHIMQAIKNRTFALRLPNGKYAKLQLINAYQGNPPIVTDLNWPAPYFTFKYFVQQNGSRNLDTN